MSALEEEIVSKFQLLDKEAQLRLLNRLEQSAASDLDWEIWLQEVRKEREADRLKYGERTISIQMIIDEMREERLNDIMGYR